jgi:hypothetical protein
MTDVAGHAHRLTKSYFGGLDSRGINKDTAQDDRDPNIRSTYLPVVREGHVPSWIHLSQTSRVTFEQSTDQTTVAIALESGETINGAFPL